MTSSSAGQSKTTTFPPGFILSISLQGFFAFFFFQGTGLVFVFVFFFVFLLIWVIDRGKEITYDENGNTNIERVIVKI